MIPASIILALVNHPTEDFDRVRPVTISALEASGLTLSRDEVHLWHIALDEHAVESLKPFLNSEESVRANRFHFARDRNHFTVARAVLRKLLSTYLRIEASDVRLSYGEMGKPFLDAHADEIRFNLAHAGGRALYGFSRHRDLGVDLELIREDFTGDDIARRFFSATEVDALQSVPDELRKNAFFNCWTRKEAYIKARGEGLSMPLDCFDVSLIPGEPAALLKNHADEAEVRRWEMRSISVADGFVAAIVVEGHGWELKTFSLEPEE
jgi:4'-phosphopantetheinyl transferase